MSESDWDTVTVLRKRPQKASQMKSEQVCWIKVKLFKNIQYIFLQAVNQARRKGQSVETNSKCKYLLIKP